MASNAGEFKQQQAKIIDLYKQVSDLGEYDDYSLNSTIQESDK